MFKAAGRGKWMRLTLVTLHLEVLIDQKGRDPPAHFRPVTCPRGSSCPQRAWLACRDVLGLIIVILIPLGADPLGRRLMMSTTTNTSLALQLAIKGLQSLQNRLSCRVKSLRHLPYWLHSAWRSPIWEIGKQALIPPHQSKHNLYEKVGRQWHFKNNNNNIHLVVYIVFSLEMHWEVQPCISLL